MAHTPSQYAPERPSINSVNTAAQGHSSMPTPVAFPLESYCNAMIWSCDHVYDVKCEANRKNKWSGLKKKTCGNFQHHQFNEKNSVWCWTQVAVSFHLFVFLYFNLLGSFDLQIIPGVNLSNSCCDIKGRVHPKMAFYCHYLLAIMPMESLMKFSRRTSQQNSAKASNNCSRCGLVLKR